MDKWDHRFIKLLGPISEWSSCYQENRKMGAIIVRDRRIITTGYNGAPAGIKSCVERGECLRRKMGIASGTRHERCYAIHAEQNALIQASKLGIAVDGATLYCTHQPCTICAKLIINAGIRRIVYQNPYPDPFSAEILREAGILVEQYGVNIDEEGRPEYGFAGGKSLILSSTGETVAFKTKSLMFQHLYEQGYTVGEIARLCGANYSFVHQVIARYRLEKPVE